MGNGPSDLRVGDIVRQKGDPEHHQYIITGFTSHSFYGFRNEDFSERHVDAICSVFRWNECKRMISTEDLLPLKHGIDYNFLENSDHQEAIVFTATKNICCRQLDVVGHFEGRVTNPTYPMNLG